MRLVTVFLGTVLVVFTAACQSKVKTDNAAASKEVAEVIKFTAEELQQYETAYFASGCFWCVEAVFESVKGVKEVISGYSGGIEENPTYEQVGYGRTTHAEAVEVFYDPKIISFFELVQVYYGSHDPTSVNRQGPDSGPQYRSIAFYKNEEQKLIIEKYKEALEESKVFSRPIATEIVPFTKFWRAEDYHQDFERRNPNNSYIRNISVPRLNRFKKNYPELLKEGAH